MRIQFKDIIQCYSKAIEYLPTIRNNFEKLIFNGFNEVEDHLWFHFIFFLNHLTIYGEIHC